MSATAARRSRRSACSHRCADRLGPVSYLKLQGSADAPADALGFAHHGMYLKGGFIHGLTPALIDTTLELVASAQLNTFDIGFQPADGANARIGATETAFWNRGASHNMHVLGAWKAGEGAEVVERNREWVRHAWTQLQPLTRGYYVNIGASDQHDDAARGAYGDNYPRLAALKQRYDPTNLFRLNANIKPAPLAARALAGAPRA